MEDYDWSHHDRSRRLHDPSHPLYVRTAYDDVSELTVDRDAMTELGPWGTRLLYGGLTLVASYFALIFVFGTH